MSTLSERILEENSEAFGTTHPELQAAMGVPLAEIAAAAARSMVLVPESDDEEPVSVSAITVRPRSREEGEDEERLEKTG